MQNRTYTVCTHWHLVHSVTQNTTDLHYLDIVEWFKFSLTKVSFGAYEAYEVLFCWLASSFVSFQNHQFITMKVVYLPPVFHVPSSAVISCAKLSLDVVKWCIRRHLWRFGLASSELQLPTPGEPVPCLFWKEFQVLADQNPLVIKNNTIVNKRNDLTWQITTLGTRQVLFFCDYCT